MEGESETDDEWVIKQTENFLLSLDISVEISAIHTFFPYGLQRIKVILLILLDKVDFSKGALSYLFVELEGSKRDGLHALVLSDELVQLENVPLTEELGIASFLAGSLPLLLLELLWRRFLVVDCQHFFDHVAMIGPIAVHLVFLLLCLLLILAEDVGQLS